MNMHHHHFPGASWQSWDAYVSAFTGQGSAHTRGTPGRQAGRQERPQRAWNSVMAMAMAPSTGPTEPVTLREHPRCPSHKSPGPLDLPDIAGDLR